MQQSQHETTTQYSGWLALVATPIGNLEDITLRALRILKEADLIASEDTRRAGILCHHFDISTPRTSYHAFNEHWKTDQLLQRVERGEKVVVLSDAGTPAISDPGFLIVRAALARGVEPLIIPGVSALTFAVVACGMPVDRFAFAGFPPVKPGKRAKFWAEQAERNRTFFVFESPHRINRLLEEVRDQLGAATSVALIREATKFHEECIRGTAGELAEKYKDKTWRGEFVVAVHPVSAEL